eukprot:CAMPEP_0118899626 /NCGR_PEP_ID=MMETSP1166-20130328/6101_1 /TAXON_ID=1104430 /ORGANISM="Chrysoreinhardia sp, Strain CCMP3193" /LENGTH=358 /DNA_ID=CAMNT_0006838757 /DNA_START=328 /DNA_END=1404 /DNA_ORIENTATION=-
MTTPSPSYWAVVDMASLGGEEAKARAHSFLASDCPPQRYVLASSSAVYGDEQVECLSSSTPTNEHHPLRQAELQVQNAFLSGDSSSTDVVIVRTPETGVISLSNFKYSELLRYYFDRVIDGHPIIPLPYEWCTAPLSFVREEDLVEVLARAATSEVSCSSSSSTVRTVHAVGNVDPQASLLRPTTLLQLARAAAIVAGLDVVKTTMFTLNAKWLAELNFPISRRSFKVLGDVANDSPWLFPERVKVQKTSSAALANARLRNRRLSPEQLERQRDEDDIIRLVAALTPFYEAYVDSTLCRQTRALDQNELPYAKDAEFRLDGSSQMANFVYKNDEYHRRLGPPRASNPILRATRAAAAQ